MSKIKLSTTQIIMIIVLAVLLCLIVAGGTYFVMKTFNTEPAPTPIPDTSWTKVQEAGVMIVGTTADYPPFEYYTPKFDLDGFDIALMKEIGAKLGVRIEFRDMAFDGLGNALQLSQIDAAIAAISVTPERTAAYGFSNIYLTSRDAILSKGDSTINQITALGQLAGLKVGVQKGTIYEKWLRDNLVTPGAMPAENLFTYTHTNLAIDALLNGSVDVVVMDFIPAEDLTKTNTLKIVGQNLNSQHYAISLNKPALQLQTKINEALIQLQNEGRVNELVRQYLNIEPPPLPTPTPIPTNVPPTAIPLPTATPPGYCIDNMQFVEDLNYEDNDMTTPPIIPPGTAFTKGWRIRNTGTCTWNNAYVLKYVGGNSPHAGMGGVPTAIQQVVPPGATYDVYVNLVAPTIPNVYQGFWSLFNANNVGFGDRIWVGIAVPPANPETPPPVPGIPQIYRFTVNANEITLGGCVKLKWKVNGDVTDVTLQRDDIVIQDQAPVQGNREDCPDTTGQVVYHLIAVGPGGRVQADEPVNVTEKPIPSPPPLVPPSITLFDVSPQTVKVGGCVDIKYKVTGDTDYISISKNGQIILDNAPDEYVISDCLDELGTFTYRIDAKNNQGQADNRESQVVVNNEPDQPDIPITGPPWTLEGYFDNQTGVFSPAIPGAIIWIKFEDDGTLAGETGCNTFSASYQKQGNQIIISNITSTRLSCNTPEGIMQMEANFLQNLKASVKIAIDQDGKLILYDNVDQELLIFFRR